MKLERTTAQLKWSLSASMAHEAERTPVRCEDGRAGGGAMEFAASTAALQLMECAPSKVRLETDLATSMERLETDLVTSWHELKRSARPRRRDNEWSTRPRRRDNKLERDGATINATSAAGNENEVRIRGKMRVCWTQ